MRDGQMSDLACWQDEARPRREREAAFARLVADYEPLIGSTMARVRKAARAAGREPPPPDEMRAVLLAGHDGKSGFLGACNSGPCDHATFPGYVAAAVRNAGARVEWNAPARTAEGWRASQSGLLDFVDKPDGLSAVTDGLPVVYDAAAEGWQFDASRHPDTGWLFGPHPDPETALIEKVDPTPRTGADMLAVAERGEGGISPIEARALGVFLAHGRKADIGEALGVSERHGGRLLDSCIMKLGRLAGRTATTGLASARPRRVAALPAAKPVLALPAPARPRKSKP